MRWTPAKGIHFVLSLFFALHVAALFFAFRPLKKAGSESDAEDTQVASLSTFIDSHYFVQKESKPFLKLQAKKIQLWPSKREYFFILPRGHFFNQQLEETYFNSRRGFYYIDEEEIKLLGTAHLWDNLSHLRAEKIIYYTGKDRVEAETDVHSKTYFVKNQTKVFINSDRVQSLPKRQEAYYQGNVRGKLVEFKSYRPPTFFRSLALNIFLQQSFINLLGNVRLKRNLMIGYGQKGEIYLENNNRDLKLYSLYENTRLYQYTLEGDKKSVWRKAYAERLDGIPKEQKIILQGLPKLIQNGDIIKGGKMILYEKSKVAEVEEANSRFYLQ